MPGLPKLQMLFVLPAIAVLLPATGHAQKKTAVDWPADQSTQSTVDPMQQIISVEFAGGTVDEYVGMVRKAAAGTNIVITGMAGDFILPDIQLNKVPVDSALDCIVRASRDQLSMYYSDHVVFVEDDRQPPTTGVTVINVKQLLASVDKADVLTAIEVGMEMQGEQPVKIELKLHEETGLLFVKGLHSQTHLVTEIVNQMMMGIPSGGLGGGGGFGMWTPGTGPARTDSDQSDKKHPPKNKDN